MFHEEIDALVELDPGKGRVIIPEDFQNSTGQGPMQPGLHEMVALLWGGTSTNVIQRFYDKKIQISLLLNVPNVNVD